MIAAPNQPGSSNSSTAIIMCACCIHIWAKECIVCHFGLCQICACIDRADDTGFTSELEGFYDYENVVENTAGWMALCVDIERQHMTR